MQAENFPKLEEIVKGHVLKALELSGGNKAKAAGLLGVSIKTVYNHVNRYNLDSVSTTESAVVSSGTEEVTVEASQPQTPQSSGSEQASDTLPAGNGSSNIFG